MHAIDLADLAITFVKHSAALVALGSSPTRETVNSYWLACRFRHEEWTGRLARHRVDIQRPGASFRHHKWHEIYPVIQEVLLSEPLSRCIAYHAKVLDERGINTSFAPLSNMAMASHVEARNRCLNLIVFGQGLPVEQAVRLNRLRRLMEHLTGQLVAAMHPVENLADFCFDLAETRQLQDALKGGWQSPLEIRVHTAGLAENLWSSAQPDLDWRTSSGRLNHRQSQVVLELLGRNLFDSFGVAMTHGFSRYLALPPESNAASDDSLTAWAQPMDVLSGSKQRICKQPDRRW